MYNVIKKKSALLNRKKEKNSNNMNRKINIFN